MLKIKDCKYGDTVKIKILIKGEFQDSLQNASYKLGFPCVEDINMVHAKTIDGQSVRLNKLNFCEIISREIYRYTKKQAEQTYSMIELEAKNLNFKLPTGLKEKLTYSVVNGKNNYSVTTPEFFMGYSENIVKFVFYGLVDEEVSGYNYLNTIVEISVNNPKALPVGKIRYS